ncbi:MAG TPA: hypothetical protein VJ001_09310 [Rhodocyclaceae bacterium]|nr:hypothetical protein [Rhodocyclaceae bacterium]
MMISLGDGQVVAYSEYHASRGDVRPQCAGVLPSRLASADF